MDEKNIITLGTYPQNSDLHCVNFDGYIEGGAEDANETNCCVRPTFWLNTEQ